MELGYHRVAWKFFPDKIDDFVTFDRESLPHEQPTDNRNISSIAQVVLVLEFPYLHGRSESLRPKFDVVDWSSPLPRLPR